jgi:hypothetical protein
MAAYRKQEEPQIVPNVEQIAWTAGFLEGEGTFSAMNGNDHRARVSAGQKEKEPLENLLRWFGGRIYSQRGRQYHMWMLRGVEAHKLMRLLLPQMSGRRQAQIEVALAASYSVPHGSPERFAQRSMIRRNRTNTLTLNLKGQVS